MQCRHEDHPGCQSITGQAHTYKHIHTCVLSNRKCSPNCSFSSMHVCLLTRRFIIYNIKTHSHKKISNFVTELFRVKWKCPQRHCYGYSPQALLACLWGIMTEVDGVLPPWYTCAQFLASSSGTLCSSSVAARGREGWRKGCSHAGSFPL